MRVLRAIGSACLWALAVLGVLSGLLWLGNQLGWVQPLVVASGSMEPDIRTGDLLLATPTPVEEVEVGEVTTLFSTQTNKLVTHRVIAVERDGTDYLIRMQGDANDIPDSRPYTVRAGTEVWQPAVTLPGVGNAAMTIARPIVAIPLAIAVLALLGLTLLGPPTEPRQRRPAAVRDST